MSVRLMDAVLLLNYIIKKVKVPYLRGLPLFLPVLAAALERTHIGSAGAGRAPDIGGFWNVLA